MSALTSELVAFLNARLDEDVASVEAVATLSGSPDWHSVERDDGGATLIVTASGVELGGEREELAEHHARHDPARVVREVAAKRAIVRRAAVHMDEPDQYPNGLVSPRALLARQTLMNLAAVYCTHPDYRPDWKP